MTAPWSNMVAPILVSAAPCGKYLNKLHEVITWSTRCDTMLPSILVSWDSCEEFQRRKLQGGGSDLSDEKYRIYRMLNTEICEFTRTVIVGKYCFLQLYNLVFTIHVNVQVRSRLVTVKRKVKNSNSESCIPHSVWCVDRSDCTLAVLVVLENFTDVLVQLCEFPVVPFEPVHNFHNFPRRQVSPHTKVWNWF